jgi:predicted transcriptional regulator
LTTVGNGGTLSPTVTGKTLTEGLRVNVTPEQRVALEELATRDERSVAAIIRRFIREGLERENWKVKT